ncbi:hypothetical protein SAMN03097694_1899 [Janthinobacterium lividum]|uniref:Uncharacterized protein n=1 Tax=Janthinobacterium lividum TaxID=29581 RepID=A0AB38C693_9BURK|nr:hypothetical protein [Janthinobacterium lividum]SFX38815.1 hypothetical protein SAMN03097694_1899 [Janthinobacterium lividum]
MQEAKQNGLRGPWVDVPYEPALYHFLGPFDVYDREHTLGAELATWNMNDPVQRAALIRRDITSQYKELSYRHRHALVAVLAQALQDPAFDFQAILEHDPESTYALPALWDEMDDPRAFFADIYRLVQQDWRDDLARAAAEDPVSW